jgi:competence protein ComEA
MLRFSKNISGWFGYSRRERRASFILLVIIFLVIAFRFLTTGKRTDVTIIPPFVLEREQPFFRSEPGKEDTARLFPFDPNSSSEEEFMQLGMNQRQVRTLLNYRQKGGRFRKPQDIFRIYGIDSSILCSLVPYINIKATHGNLKKTSSYGSVKRDSGRMTSKFRTDLNRCDSAGLEKLPGIGPALSARIIRYREILGGFYSVDQLKEVYGLSDSTFRFISGRLMADSTAIKQIEINKAKFGELMKHPYLELYDVKALLKYRAIRGKIDSISQLVEDKILTPARASRLRPYIRF